MGQILLCCVLLDIKLHSHPSLYSLDASSTPPTVVTTETVSRQCQMSLGTKSPPVEITTLVEPKHYSKEMIPDFCKHLEGLREYRSLGPTPDFLMQRVWH